ncbi:MFS general substrate transporter [Collybia nuda]|uniref:MFS general substrate transporter n=1 Tax=Collybia nuda TaxID=64659 RepID=A0A9P6CFN5_9AGAR|nr:MFS general substrate transporter [Collybia nuda]
MSEHKSDPETPDTTIVQHSENAGDDVEEETFPEGGWQAWMTVLGAALVQFSTFGYTNAFGVYQGAYVWIVETPSCIGWIGGIQIFLVLGSGIITGRAFDRGYFHHLMIAGSLLHAFSFFMLSLAHENQYYQIILSQGLGGGLGAGIIYTPCVAIGSHYFKRNLPVAIGLVAAGTALGAVLHPIMLNHLLHDARSFPHAVRMSAVLNSSLLVVANLMMRTRLPPKKNITVIPYAAFARDVPYLFLLLGGMLIICAFSFPVFFLQLYGNANGFGQGFVQYCFPIMNASSILGRIIPATLAPRVGVINLAIICTLCMSILMFSLRAVTNTNGLIAFSAIYGFFSGGGVALTPAMLASLARDVDEIGARIGVSFALSGTIGLFAIPIAGALLTSELHWWRPIIFGGTTMLSGACCYIITRFLVARRRGTQLV